jgi:hypothetical protein
MTPTPLSQSSVGFSHSAPPYKHNPASRIITNLKWAHPLPSRPSIIPASRPRGAKGAGLRFEKAIAKAIPSALHGTWFEFEDKGGHGYCQTDIIYTLRPDLVVVIEVKYTLVPGAHSKLVNLYIPVVTKALNRPVVGVVAVKNLDPRFRRGRIFTEIESAALYSLSTGYPSLIQWAGQSLTTAQSHMPACSEAAPPGVPS